MIPFNQSFTFGLFISRIYDIEYVSCDNQEETKKIIVHIEDDYNIPSYIKQTKKQNDIKILKEMNKDPKDNEDEEEDDDDEEEEEDVDIILDDNHNRISTDKSKQIERKIMMKKMKRMKIEDLDKKRYWMILILI